MNYNGQRGNNGPAEDGEPNQARKIFFLHARRAINKRSLRYAQRMWRYRVFVMTSINSEQREYQLRFRRSSQMLTIDNR